MIVQWRLARAAGDRQATAAVEADPEFPRLAETWNLRDTAGRQRGDRTS